MSHLQLFLNWIIFVLKRIENRNTMYKILFIIEKFQQRIKIHI